MVRLAGALPETVGAAEWVRRYAARAASRNGYADLLQVLALIENNFILGGPAVPPRLLRDLVIATTGLAGRSWLSSNESSPEVAAFLALHSRPAPPALPVLDRIVSDLLRMRFRHASAASAA
jgi:hypothetical protein